MKMPLRPVMITTVLAISSTAACSALPTLPIPPSGSGGTKPGQVEVVRSDKPRLQVPVADTQGQETLASDNAAFAFDLYQTMRSQSGNLFYSPYSISLALAMTYAGASGDTASQMARVLHVTRPGDSLHAAFNAYSQSLEARAAASDQGAPFELSIANSLWGQSGFTFRQDFLDVLAQNYDAGIRLVDFVHQPEPSRQAINQWVSDETKKRIQDLIPQGAVDPLTRLVLANAIYFKAGWLHTFDGTATANDAFYLPDGSTVPVAMMYQSESFDYAIMPGYRAIELPYQTGGLSMLIVLPDEGKFEAVESQLGPAMLAEVGAGLKHGPVVLSLPKFSYSSSFGLNATLKSMGMSDAFDARLADFSGIDGARDLYITDVVHKAFVAVDEKGTEAAAATAVIIGLTSAPALQPIEFKVDRPFIYLIRDEQTGAILFMGRVSNPAA